MRNKRNESSGISLHEINVFIPFLILAIISVIGTIVSQPSQWELASLVESEPGIEEYFGFYSTGVYQKYNSTYKVFFSLQDGSLGLFETTDKLRWEEFIASNTTCFLVIRNKEKIPQYNRKIVTVKRFIPVSCKK